MGSSIVTARPRIVLDPLPAQPQAMAPIPQSGAPHIVLDPLPSASAVSPVQPGAVATGGLNPSPPALSWQGAVQHPAAFAGQVFERTFDPTGAIRESAEATLKGIPQAAKSLLGGAQSVVGTVEDINNLTSRVGTRLTGKPDLNSRALSKRIADLNVSIKKPEVTSPSLQEGLADPRLLGRAVGGVVGSSAVPMAATIGAGVVGGIPGATIVSTMLNAGDVFNTLTDAGINANEAALTAGLSMAALDAIVPLRALGLWNKKGLEQAIKAGIAKTPKSTIRTWAKEAALEGATETAQEGIAAGTEAAHGIKQPNLFWRLVNAGLGGTLIGFGVGAAGRPSAAETTVAPPPRFEPMGPPAPPPPPAAPAAPAPVQPRMVGTNAPAFQASAPPPTGPFASRVPTPTAPRAGPPLTAVPKLEGTNAPQFQGAPPTPTGPFASRIPTPTQPPIQGPAVRPPYEPQPAEGVEPKDLSPGGGAARRSAVAFGITGPRQTPPAGPMSPAEQSAQVLMRANQGARRATVTPQESRLGDPAAELLGEAREEVSRLLSTPRDPVHPNDPIVHEHLWEWLGSEDPRAVVIREQLIEVWPRRSAPGPDPVPSRTDLLVWAKEVEKSQQQPTPPPAPPVVSEPAVEAAAPSQPLIPPPPQQAPPPPALSLGPQRLSPPPQPGATPTATAAAIAPPPAVAPFRQQVTMPGTPAPPTPTAPPAGDMVIQTAEGPQVADSAQVLTDKVLTVAEEAPEVKPAVPQSTLDKWDAEGKAADEELRSMGLFTGGRASMGAFLDPKVISKMALSIRGDVARFVIHAGNAVEKIVAKFGEDYRPIAVQVFEEARKLAGMPSAAPPVSSGASAAASVSQAEADRGGKALLDMKSQGTPGMTLEGGAQYSTGPGRERSVVVRDSKGQPIAVLGFYAADSGVGPAPPSHEAYPTVYVAPEHRRKGIAKRMYEFAKQQGYDLSQLSGRETSPMGEALVGSLRQTGVLGPQTAPGAPATPQPSVTATQPTGSPQGQPAQIPGQPPPLPTEPRDMPSLRTEGLTIAQRVNIGIRTVGTINRNNLQFRQMAEQNPDFQPIQDQLAAKNRMDRTIQDWKNKGGDAMEEWNALGEERGRQLSDFNYTVQDWTQRANRPLTEQEVMQLADKAGLDEETVAVYQRQQQTFREFWEGLRQAEVSELEREIKDPEALASAIATLNKEVDEKARRNYFPLMRFGDWMVTSYLKTDDPKYPSGKKVHRHEQYATEKAAEEAATRMERDYAAAGIVPENVTVGELSPEVRDMGHLPPSIAERLASKLNLTDKQRAAFDDMMASTMVERSGRQHQKYREGIPGYSRDGKRTAGAYFSAMSNLIGRTAERGNILQAVNDARTYRKNLRAETPGQFVNLTKINRMIEFMDDAAKNQISPKVHSNTLSGAMMLWWLGYNPKQILLNFTQLGQGVAVLADQVGPDGEKVGTPAATAQMLKAILDVSHAYSKRVFSKDKHKVVGAPGDQQNYIGNLTREEWEALENARLSGLVGETNAKMVTQHAKTSTLEKLGGRISGISGEEAGRKRDEQFAHLAEGSMAGFQWSEEWLRRTILVASGRAMKAKGSANPWGTAEQVVRSSQGSHEASNRSKLQRDWPKTLIFKSFLLNNAYLGTLSPYRRKIWLAQLLLAGLTGGFAMEHFFQLIDTLGSLFNWHFFGMKNPRVDLQHAIREWVNWGAGKASVPGAGPYASEFLLKGLAGGIPGNPWDLQASTSQGKALPFIEQFLDLINGTTTPQNALWKTAEDITGLAGSTAMNATKALVEDSPTSENIIRTVMPKAVSQPIQAARALAAGGVRDSKGAKLITLDPSKPRDVIEILGMAGGIQPKRLTQAREQKWAPKELNLYYDNLLRGLQNDYNKARATKDPQVIRAMNKEIIRINREVLPQGFNRTLGEYLDNYNNRNKGLRKEERGVPPGAVRRRGYVKGYMGAYGERAQ